MRSRFKLITGRSLEQMKKKKRLIFRAEWMDINGKKRTYDIYKTNWDFEVYVTIGNIKKDKIPSAKGNGDYVKSYYNKAVNNKKAIQKGTIENGQRTKVPA